MGAMTLDVEGWCKKDINDPPVPVQKISFHVSESLNLQLEALEEELRNTDKRVVSRYGAGSAGVEDLAGVRPAL